MRPFHGRETSEKAEIFLFLLLAWIKGWINAVMDRSSQRHCLSGSLEITDRNELDLWIERIEVAKPLLLCVMQRINDRLVDKTRAGEPGSIVEVNNIATGQSILHRPGRVINILQAAKDIAL